MLIDNPRKAPFTYIDWSLYSSPPATSNRFDWWARVRGYFCRLFKDVWSLSSRHINWIILLTDTVTPKCFQWNRIKGYDNSTFEIVITLWSCHSNITSNVPVVIPHSKF